MAYGREGYRKYSSDEKISMVLRSAVQDACLVFKKESIDVMFPEKIVDKVDIGKVASKWTWKIIGSLNNNTELQKKLLRVVWLRYNQGKNLDKDEIWHHIWRETGLPLFSDKINDLPATGKVAPMDKLEKEPPKDTGKDFDDRQW